MVRLITPIFCAVWMAVDPGLPQAQASSTSPVPGVEVKASSPGLTAEQIVDKANKLFRGDASHARVSMTVERPEWKRTLDIESWNLRRDKAFIVVHAPAKDKGTTTLRIGPEMWLWMPRVERVIKVPPTMMHSAWMGSNFTYEDIVKADSIFRDYTHKIVGREQEEGRELVTIEGTPRPDAPVVWGKIRLKCAVYPDGTVISMSEEDYSERGELIRTILLSEVGILGGKTLPTRLECIPRKKSGERTILKYREIDFDVQVPDSMFSLERLQKNK